MFIQLHNYSALEPKKKTNERTRKVKLNGKIFLTLMYTHILSRPPNPSYQPRTLIGRQSFCFIIKTPHYIHEMSRFIGAQICLRRK